MNRKEDVEIVRPGAARDQSAVGFFGVSRVEQGYRFSSYMLPRFRVRAPPLDAYFRKMKAIES
jgi:hypothetical protein